MITCYYRMIEMYSKGQGSDRLYSFFTELSLERSGCPLLKDFVAGLIREEWEQQRKLFVRISGKAVGSGR